MIRAVIDRSDRAMRERKIHAHITIELDQHDWDDFKASLPPMVFADPKVAGWPTLTEFAAITVNDHTVRLKR